jgi:endonuclease-3
MINMTKKQRGALCVEALEKEYPDAICSLVYEDPLQLLIAVRLSAQCTDERVNKVTPALFEKYPDLESFCNAEVEDIEKLIYSCGFYKTKAKDIKEMSVMIRDVFGGRVPDSIEKLTSLPGVGRKTANLIMGDVYKQPAIVADTHLIRITNLIGLVDTKDPKKVELELKKIIEGDKSNDFCHRMVLHGRAVCIARRPQCQKCCIKDYCKTGSKK